MMRRTWLLFLALLFPAGCQQALQMSDPVAAQSADASACQALRALNLDNLPDGTSARVSSASLMTVGPEGLADPGVPLNWAIDKHRVQQYCEVVGYAARQNQFLLRLPLPTDWNQKFFFVACDGLCGRVQPSRTNAGLAAGYASVSSNGGHVSGTFDGIWGDHDPALQEDFAFRGNHAVTLAAKAITTAYYEQPIRRSYMAGYSKGGHATLMAAQRYPADYDGVIVGAPVYRFIDSAIIGMAWAAQANTDGEGGVLIDARAAAILHEGALAACDANDGIADGLIYDPARCDFQPSALLCSPGETSDCLSGAQVAAAERLYAGPTDSSGAPITNAPQAVGSETSWGAWLYPSRSGLNLSIGLYYNVVRYLAFEGNPPEGFPTESLKFDFDRDPQRLARARALYDADDPDLHPFKARGGKLLLWHGLADGAIGPGASVDYYNRVTQAMGGVASTIDFFRLYLLPGVHHGGGGPGPDQFNSLDVLDAWVESDAAPFEIVVGHKSDDGIDRTLPLYPYPLVTQYNGSGDVDEARSYHAVDPNSGRTADPF